jgi:hypothetical protein
LSIGVFYLLFFLRLTPSQSYVDIVLSATLDIDTFYAGKMGNLSFSQEFMQTTKGWDTANWVCKGLAKFACLFVCFFFLAFSQFFVSHVQVNDRVKPRRPWEFQSNVQSIDTVLLGYLGQPALDAIVLDSVSTNQTLVNQVARHETAIAALQGDVATLQSTTTGVQSNVSIAQSNIATLQTNVGTLQSNVVTLQSNVVTLQSNVVDLQGNVSTLAAGLADTNARLANITIELQAEEAHEAAFELKTNADLASVHSTIKLMKSDMAQMRKDIIALTARVEVDENNYNGLLIMWIVSVVVIVAATGVGFFLVYRKMGQQAESMSESIPLRPSRGYSYT